MLESAHATHNVKFFGINIESQIESSHFFCCVEIISIHLFNFLTSHNLIVSSCEVDIKYKSLYKLRLVIASLCPLIDSDIYSLE